MGIIEMGVVSAFVFLIAFCLGSAHGKKTTLTILRGHESEGKTLKEALDYEIAVINHKKPWSESD